MRRSALFALALCLAAHVAAAAPRLTTAERDAVYAGVIAALKADYVFPEKVPAITAALAKAKAEGRYDGDDAATFTERLTEDLSTAGHDRHLYVFYDPAQYAAVKNAKPEDTAEDDNFYRSLAIRENSGLTEMKILPGNIRLLRITGFQWIQDHSGADYDAAFHFLKDADAIIIDIRSNGGGDHGAVRYLLSHFLKPETKLMTFLEAGHDPVQSHTLDYLPGGRLTGKPLAVLIDGQVASAAEEVAYSVKHFKLGTLVGTKTAGGANNNKLVPVAPGFLFSISYGRPEHPVSHSNWEGTGVAPDVEASWQNAPAAAEAVLLKALLATPKRDAKSRAYYQWALLGAEAQLNPPKLAEAELQAKAGRYGERVEVSFRDGALWYLARPGAPMRRLTPLNTTGLFAVEGRDEVRIQFTAAGMESYRMGDPNPLKMPKR